ncbi:LamG-like jellyroll fold domain-containing protein [Streptomyces narbonensis]|uniref:LamG-like jellyroll fold domain-containing protein n=1 Tax=Streptomyces narbonensis TaxID=67333 RepID=UPI00340E1238
MLATSPAMADETPAAALTESEQALQEAAGSGERVEVVGERTERETVFANPDGATFTLEKSIAPVRVDTGSGWVQPDATLVRREDGSIGPKAAVVDVSFSTGGSGADLVTIGQDGQSVSMGWPGQLPEPRLDGERAVYENVLPDVNLILTASVEGFRQVLEVETPEAAALPELKSIEYGLATDGLRLREGAVGSVEALDGNGQVVFRSPTARMWNSAGDDGVATSEAGMGTQSAGFRALTGVPADSASAQADVVPVGPGPSQEGDPLAGPGAGDEAAVMDVALAQDSMTVTPDSDLVAGTEAADFPLYIDPSVELVQSQRTVLSSDGDVFYNFDGGANGMSVGKCGTAVINGQSYYCGEGWVNRMYFEFTPSRLAGKHVLDASFRVTETWSFSCNPRWVDLKRTDRIYSSSKWPGPTARDHMGDRLVSAGRGTACSPSQPRAVIDFNDNPAEGDENLTATTRDLASGKLKVLTLRLSATDETDTEAWKRFDDDGTLVVKYVSKPAVPAEYGLPSGSTQICSKSESAPTMISDTTPTLVATPRVVYGGESEAMLRVYYDVDGRATDGTWLDAPEPTTGSVAPATGHLAYSSTLKDFPNTVKDWNVALKEGTLYRYRAFTQSLLPTPYTGALSSGATAYCYFKVDPTGPKPPVVTFNSVYSECRTGGPCEFGGLPGRAGSVTFSSASGDSNTAYQYKLSTHGDWSGWKTATAGSYTTTITPSDAGAVVLSVIGKDSLGRTGERAVKFLVNAYGPAYGSWTFNEASGVALDGSAPTAEARNNLTLTPSGATRSDHGRRGVLTAADGSKLHDKALSLNRSSYGGASTTKQAVETQVSYSVMAWVRLTSTSDVAAVLAQDGTVHSSFYLSYCKDVDRWCIRLPDTDTAGSAFSGQRVDAVNAPQLNVWTHLGFVVDREKDELRFYVNGVLQKDADKLTGSAWASKGGLQVGRAKYDGSYTDHFPGEIDEIIVRQDALDTSTMADTYASPKDPTTGKGFTELVAQYNPSTSGASLSDVSGYGNTLTLGSGASLDGENIVLNGAGAYATTTRSLVDDSGSFSVSTAVDLDTEKLKSMTDGTRMQVVGKKTATGSSWGIWFEKTGTRDVPGSAVDPATGKRPQGPAGRWHFGRWKVDAAGVSVSVSVQSDELLIPRGEIQLTGVFDAAKSNKTVTLYAGTDRQGDPLVYKSEIGSTFTVGKSWIGSTWGGYMPGKIGDIRVWVGALSDAQQVESVVGL